MRSRLAGVIAVLVWSASVTIGAQREFQFFASVVGADGAPVESLTPGDARVTEDGMAVKVTKVEPIDWPVSVAVLVGNGPGMTQSLADLRQGVLGLLEALPEGVEVSLQTTAPQPRWLVRATKDRDALKQGVERLATDDGQARFVDALRETATRFDRDKAEVFPVIVMVGSTTRDASETRERELERMMDQLRRRATVHIVMLPAATGGGGGRGRGGARGAVAGVDHVAVAKALAGMTGGRYEAIAAPSSLVTLLPEIGAQIARSHRMQSRQFRIAVERPNASAPLGDIRMVAGEGTNTTLTINGRLP